MNDQYEVLCIGRQDKGEKNDVRVMQQALQVSGANAQLAYWENLVFYVADGEAVAFDSEGKRIGPRLAVLLNWMLNGNLSFMRDVAYSLGLILGRQGVKLWNSEVLSQRSTTKLSCMVQLMQQGYAVPDTLYSLNGTILVEHVIRKLPAPWIVKSITASRGRDNFLVHEEAELRKILSDSSLNPFMVQEFIPNDNDLRVICFGGEPAMVIRRSRAKDSDTHLNNTSAGGSAEQVPLTELPAGLAETAKGIAQTMGREMAGIDFIIDSSAKKEYICLEVNSIPQLTSGSYVDEKMASFVRSVTHTLNNNAEKI